MRFDVVDTGVGLTDKQIETLFRPFMQADSSTTRKFGGTGLGLTISKRLAKMLGGDLSVNSVPGSGSTFSLTVETGDLSGVAMIENPKTAVPATLSAAAAASPAQALQIVKLTGRVLLAEDGPDNRVLISYYLREVGLDVTMVENGLLARDAALHAKREGEPFDLILMDMQMPEMDGYEATRHLRAAGYHRPIVALTAHAMGGDRDKCLQAGCDEFAVKPIEWEKLLAVLRRYVQETTATAEPAPPAKHSASGASVFDAAHKLTDAADVPPAATSSSFGASSPYPQRSGQLQALMSKPGMAKLVEKFLARLGERVDALRAAAAASDLQQLKTLAHQLKGAAGGYGFPAISDAAKSIEHAAVAPDADIDAITEQIRKLADLCDQARHHAPVMSTSSPGDPS
jgi:CheY-like chemotaxis protein/HPt (histidine-containing phosphotransfer) domain-containing protein